MEQQAEQQAEQQKQNMHKAVVNLFFKNSDFAIMPKALNQWKRWVQVRKLMRRYAAFSLNCMNHPLAWAFRRWKYQEAVQLDKLKNVHKTDLIEKIVQDEMQIGSCQSRIARMEDAIDHLNI